MYSITVGIPYHKSVYKDQLKNCIDSIVNQKEPPSLIHLIQDGPVNAEIKKVIEPYLELGYIKHICFDDNQGLAKVLNHSINQTNTTYYARMDADDIAHPERLKKQISFLEENLEIDILGTWATDIDDNDKQLSLRKVPSIHEEIVKYIWTNPLIHPTVVFRTESIKKTGLYDPSVRKRQDYEFWFRCAKKGLRFANLPEPLLYYRFTEDWFKRNNSKVIWNQVKMGWKGCYDLKLPIYSYLGVSIPLVKILFPKKMGVALTNLLKKVDPRSK